MINHNFINKALDIDHSMKVSKVAKHIRSETHPNGYLHDARDFGGSKPYLSKSYLVETLRKMNVGFIAASAIANQIRASANSAYERGVFVVTDRVLKGRDLDTTSAQSLLSSLRAKEEEFFTPTLWYPHRSYNNIILKYTRDIDLINAVSPLFLRHARAAFAHGLRDACDILTDDEDISY